MAGTFQVVHVSDIRKSTWASNFEVMSSLIAPQHSPTPDKPVLPAARSFPNLVSPHAMLLDFGGVIFQTSKHADGRDRLAQVYAQLVQDAGFDIPAVRLRESIDAGLTALKHWKNASSRRLSPEELSHREVVVDFMASELPIGPRELLASHATELVKQQNLLISGHELRPGIRELIDACIQQDIPLGIVSNAHSGASHREILQRHGLHDVFDVQIYSDEVGIRKPHPDMIRLAADALGTDPGHCWYVGDTQDRDVVAGRRSGVGAVILTRCHHTDTPPFTVHDQPDAIFDDPTGVVRLFEQIQQDTPHQEPFSTSQRPEPPQGIAGVSSTMALFIDHGGVISDSEPDPAARSAFLEELATVIQPATATPLKTAQHILDSAIAGHKAAKVSRREANDHTEVTPSIFWGVHGAAGQNAQITALLKSEAHRLMNSWGLAKSRRVMRTGIAELLSWCARQGHPVVIVSNTVSGASVRAQLAHHGIAEHVTAVVASDEYGLRKPHPNIVRAALAIADTAPESAFFLGDKPENDAAAAAQCGIAHRVLVRGGSTGEAQLTAALNDGTATHLVDEPGDLLPLMQTFSATNH